MLTTAEAARRRAQRAREQPTDDSGDEKRKRWELSAKEMARREKQRAASERAKERNRIVRWPQLLEIIPLGETAVRERFIATGRLRPVPMGPRSVGFVEAEAYRIVDEMIAERDAAAAAKVNT